MGVGGGVGDWVGVSEGRGAFFLLKKRTPPLKNGSFAKKKKYFFTQKDLPASQKTDILHEKLTKNVP